MDANDHLNSKPQAANKVLLCLSVVITATDVLSKIIEENDRSKFTYLEMNLVESDCILITNQPRVGNSASG